jgi:hypothetical protein
MFAKEKRKRNISINLLFFVKAVNEVIRCEWGNIWITTLYQDKQRENDTNTYFSYKPFYNLSLAN